MQPKPALSVNFSCILRHWSHVGRSPVDNPLYKYLQMVIHINTQVLARKQHSSPSHVGCGIIFGFKIRECLFSESFLILSWCCFCTRWRRRIHASVLEDSHSIILAATLERERLPWDEFMEIFSALPIHFSI